MAERATLEWTCLDVARTRTCAGYILSRARVRGVEADSTAGASAAGRFDAAFHAGGVVGAVILHAEACGGAACRLLTGA